MIIAGLLPLLDRSALIDAVESLASTLGHMQQRLQLGDSTHMIMIMIMLHRTNVEPPMVVIRGKVEREDDVIILCCRLRYWV